MERFDALVVGAGPAGCSAALNLAPTRRVVLVDRQPDTPARIGESLPPVAGRLLADMGLLDAFRAQGHAPCHGVRSVWGGAEPLERDGLRDPDGHGWHLDRARFDAWLRRVAVARGATLVVPASLAGVERDGDGWRVTLGRPEGARVLRARVLIDASGRTASLAHRLGARRRVLDRLVCAWVHGRATGAPAQAGLGSIEAVADGWWYSAPLPGGRRMLAFHTDADLPAARGVRSVDGLMAAARTSVETAALLEACGFVADGLAGFTAAHSTALHPAAGPGWFAAGDAVLGFDPLSSQGILNALHTGLAAAEAADRCLSGEERADGYRQAIGEIEAAYHKHLGAWYALETRWPDRPFWNRRQGRAVPGQERTGGGRITTEVKT